MKCSARMNSKIDTKYSLHVQLTLKAKALNKNVCSLYNFPLVFSLTLHQNYPTHSFCDAEASEVFPIRIAPFVLIFQSF